MATTPQAAPQSSHSSEGSAAIDAGQTHLQVALPRWASIGVVLLSVGSGAAISGYSTYLKLTSMHKDENRQEQIRDQEVMTDLQTKALADHNKSLVPIYKDFEAREALKHQTDAKKDFESKDEVFKQDGSVTINHFFRDGCLQIVRRQAGQDPQSSWIFGPSVIPPTAMDAEKIPASIPLPPSPPAAPLKIAVDGHPHLRFAVFTGGNKPRLLRAALQGGQCKNPHPGTFTATNEQSGQCIVVQTRTYQDGCVGTQNLNRCTGSWDIQPDGTPRVVWKKCVH